MGQQHYEAAIRHAILQVAPSSISFDHLSYGPRSSTGDVRRSVKFARFRDVAQLPHARALFQGADVIHRMDLRIPPGSKPEVVTVHDLPPLRFPDEGSLPRWALSALAETPVICPSEFAANEVQVLLGARDVTVIPYGISPEFTAAEPFDSIALESLGITGSFVLHAAGSTIRKNLDGLAEAWSIVAASHDSVQLVLCGPQSSRRLSLFGSLPRVIMPGYVDLVTVSRLMASSLMVVVPSTYEGFGLPALEAMGAGAPVVAASCGALPEVCGEAAVLAPPDGPSLALAMSEVLRDSERRVALRDAGRARVRNFSWAHAAERHIEVYINAFRRAQ